MKKIKTHVLMVAKTYPVGHGRAGQLTGFKTKILTGEKKHTLRVNWAYWLPRILDVQVGDAILSLREWSGKPYNSNQVEFHQLTQDDCIDIQHVTNDPMGNLLIDDQKLSRNEIAKNDGLLPVDFMDWFSSYVCLGPKELSGGVIHFSNFRYAPRPNMDTQKSETRKGKGNIVVGCGPSEGISTKD